MSVSETVKSAGDSWIICRSKSYSGRIYYFNTLSGEAVWNLSEPEIEKAKNTTKVLEKHPDFKIVNCPEPSESPQDSHPQNQISVNQLMQPKIYNKQVINNSFSKSHKNDQFLSYTQLAPIQFNIPIAPFNPIWNASPQSISVAPSNISESTLMMNEDNCVPSQTSISLSNRFQNLCDSDAKSNSQLTGPFKRNYGKKNSMYTLSRKQFYKNNQEPFHNSDLRTLLTSKRRNFINESPGSFEEFGEHSSSNVDSQVLYEPKNETIPYDTDDDYWLQENLKSQAKITKIDTNSLKSLLQVEDTSSWYIVTDSNVLLNHVNFINILMKSDSQCRLMIPQQVMNKIKCATNSRLRTQAHRAAYFISEKVDENVAIIDQDDAEENVVYKDAIINCCTKLIEECNSVVLLSDDIELHSTECPIPIYTVMEFKKIFNNPKSHGILPKKFKNVPLKHNRNIKITIENDATTDKLDQLINTNNISTDTIEEDAAAYEYESYEDYENLTRRSNDRNEVIHEHIFNNLKSLKKKTDDIGVQADTTDLIMEQEKLVSNNTNNKLQCNNTEFFSQTKSIKLKRQTSLDIPNLNTTMRHSKLNNRKAKSTLSLISENSITDKSNIIANFVSNSTECIESVINNENATDTILIDKNKCDSLIRKTTNVEIPKITKEFKKLIQHTKQSKNQNTNQSENATCENITDASLTGKSKGVDLITEATHIEITTPTVAFEKIKQSKEKNISYRIENVMFEVTNQAMEDYLKMKCDEWTSRFVQIMEEALTQVLQIEPRYVLETMPPPWNIYEATECVKRKFHYVDDIFDASTKLSSVLFEFGASRGKIKTDISPNKYMEMYSYGVYLIDTLQGHLNNVEDLHTAEQSLSKLLRDIQDPHLDPSNHDLFTDSNVENQTTCNDPDALNETFESIKSDCNNTNLDAIGDCTPKTKSSNMSNVSSNYRLRSHRKRLLQEQENNSVPEITFVRNIDIKSTFFTNLNLRNNCVKNNDEGHDTIVTEKEKNYEIVNDDEIVNHSKTVKHGEMINDGEIENINKINTSTILLKDLEDNQAKAEPKIIRNFTKCVEFEEKLKNNNPETDSVRDNWLIQSESDYTGNEELDYEDDDEYFYDNDYDDYEYNDEENELQFDDNANDKNENFKLFMEKLKDVIKVSFLAIHSFCTKSHGLLSSSESEVSKSKIQDIGTQTFTHLNGLCNAFSRILTRDTVDGVYRLNELLQIDSPEEHIIDDDVIEEYTAFIKKCEEQGSLLRDSIKLILEMTEE